MLTMCNPIVLLDLLHRNLQKDRGRPNETRLLFSPPSTTMQIQLSKFALSDRLGGLVDRRPPRESQKSNGKVPASRGADLGSQGKAPASRGADLGSNGKAPASRGADLGSNGKVPASRGADLSSNGKVPASRGADLGSNGKAPASRGADLGSNGKVPASRGADLGSNGKVPASRGADLGSNGKAPASRGADLGSNAVFPHRTLSRSSHTSDSEHGTPVVTQPGTWGVGVGDVIGLPDVSIL